MPERKIVRIINFVKTIIMKMRQFKYLPFMLLLFASVVQAKIKVVDGDSIFIDKREIRLSGIDAPEYHQLCYDENGQEYECGQEALKALRQLAGPDLQCKTLVRDRYKREVAVCESNGININKKMVEIGWAVAYKRYTNDYDQAEKEAKKKKRGIWQGRFMKPELYRILHKKQ